MKKSILSLLFIFSITFSNAQVWCPPGAVWHYNYSNFAVEGFVKFEYTGDTVINSVNCKVLDVSHNGYTYWNSQNYSFNQKRFTYDSLGVIYFYVDSLSEFDTLFNFKAGPGDHWEMISFYNNHPQCDSVHYVTVIDTGSTVMNGSNLKWTYAIFNYQTSFGNFDTHDTIYERIGTINQYIFPIDNCNAGLDVNEGGYFRCYEDNLFPLLKRSTEDCDKMPIVGINESNLESSVTVYPNPSSGTLKIADKKVKITEIKIFDNSGKLILKIKSPTDQINISDLENGIYLVEMVSEKGVIRKKIILSK